jgi:hypothetical protein
MEVRNIIPSAEEIRAAKKELGPAPASDADLTPYFPMVAKLAREAAARGERGMVIKFEVADYADEAECGRAIAAMGRLLEELGYLCCVSYDTYALKKVEGGVESSVMRNPAIIAMTVAW